MSINLQKSPVINRQTGTAEDLTRHLTAAATPAQHRERLHLMVVGWMRNLNHDPVAPEEQEAVYLTYVLLKDMLERMEGGEI